MEVRCECSTAGAAKLVPTGNRTVRWLAPRPSGGRFFDLGIISDTPASELMYMSVREPMPRKATARSAPPRAFAYLPA